MTTTMAPVGNAPFRTVQRRLAELLPEATCFTGGGTLEMAGFRLQERPGLDPPELLEGTTVRALDVDGGPLVHFAAFLDGTQTSRVAQYAGTVPIVHGTVAAVVRVRRDRRLTTWRPPLLEHRLYAPLSLVPEPVRRALSAIGADVFDTSAQRELDSIHPFALQEAALQAVERDRSALERRLAAAWCAGEAGVLLIDGGISETEVVARSDAVVGVVKSHQQLHVHGDDLGTILGLQAGQRSSVCRVTSRRRTPVASWYLRLREAAGRDPLWGLVRVEVAEPRSGGPKAVSARADAVSRWILAEALPLAVPDGRWDKMVYGIRDAEEYLRAIQ